MLPLQATLQVRDSAPDGKEHTLKDDPQFLRLEG